MANRERENPAGLATWEIIGLGVLGGAVIYAIFFRPSTTNAMTAPATTDTGARTSTPVAHQADPPVEIHASAPPMPPPNAGPDTPRPVASMALIQRLRTSEQARKVFAYQALLWSWGHYDWTFGHSNTVPDGVMTPGGPTEAKIRDINFLANDPRPVSGVFTDMSIMKAVATLGTVSTNQNYLLPMKLPRDVIDAVNATIGRMSVAIELQVVPV